MPLPPPTSSFPPGVPSRLMRSVWLDTPFDDKPGVQRSGPYKATIVPITGGQQVAKESGTIVLASDPIYLPPDVVVSSATLVTDILKNRTYAVQFVQRWGDVTEVLVSREAPDL